VEAEGEGPALEELESRLSELEALRRKHRRSLEEIAALAEEMRASLDELGRAQQTAEALASASRAAEAALQTAAAELTRARKKAGIGLAAAVRGELDAIAMTDCRLRVGFAPAEEEGGIGPTGGERVVFEAETNPGEGYRPLGEIASGGEMSRIALALRVVLGRRGRRGLSVFDEVDAGLGGGAARAVAQRLRQVSRHRQVLLVTHMPIIAAQADRHLRVAKETQEGRARVTVAPLTGAARVAEIARMLSGSPRDPQAVEHARALLRGPLGLPEARGSARS
jgi:DNA repair protein RecN (Recombination protein N)